MICWSRPKAGSPRSRATRRVRAGRGVGLRHRLRHGGPCGGVGGADRRGISGRGTGLKVSLFDGMADWMNVPLLYFEGTGRAPQRMGLAHPTICPYGAFDTRDGSAVLLSIQNEREWQAFCTHVLGEPDLPRRPGFESNNARVTNRPAVDGHIATVFASLTRDQAAARLRLANTAFGFVNDLAAFARHPALRRVSVQTPGGPAMIAAPPVIDVAGAREYGPVPAVGEHSATIRTEFA